MTVHGVFVSVIVLLILVATVPGAFADPHPGSEAPMLRVHSEVQQVDWETELWSPTLYNQQSNTYYANYRPGLEKLPGVGEGEPDVRIYFVWEHEGHDTQNSPVLSDKQATFAREGFLYEPEMSNDDAPKIDTGDVTSPRWGFPLDKFSQGARYSYTHYHCSPEQDLTLKVVVVDVDGGATSAREVTGAITGLSVGILSSGGGPLVSGSMGGLAQQAVDELFAVTGDDEVLATGGAKLNPDGRTGIDLYAAKKGELPSGKTKRGLVGVLWVQTSTEKAKNQNSDVLSNADVELNDCDEEQDSESGSESGGTPEPEGTPSEATTPSDAIIDVENRASPLPVTFEQEIEGVEQTDEARVSEPFAVTEGNLTIEIDYTGFEEDDFIWEDLTWFRLQVDTDGDGVYCEEDSDEYRGCQAVVIGPISPPFHSTEEIEVDWTGRGRLSIVAQGDLTARVEQQNTSPHHTVGGEVEYANATTKYATNITVFARDGQGTVARINTNDSNTYAFRDVLWGGRTYLIEAFTYLDESEASHGLPVGLYRSEVVAYEAPTAPDGPRTIQNDILSGNTTLHLQFVGENTGTVYGTVVDAETGDPIEGATVSLQPVGESEPTATVETDLAGQFRIDYDAGEEFAFWVTAVGYETTRPDRTYELDDGEREAIEIEMPPSSLEGPSATTSQPVFADPIMSSLPAGLAIAAVLGGGALAFRRRTGVGDAVRKGWGTVMDYFTD